MSHPSLAATAVVAIVLLSAPSHAVDTCKAKVDKKTGIIRVNATAVSGTLLWVGPRRGNGVRRPSVIALAIGYD